MSKFETKIGPEDFEGIQCDLDEKRPTDGPASSSQGTPGAAQPIEDRNVQALVVKSFLFLMIAALGTAFAVSVALASWVPLTSVWLVVAAPLGVLFDRYVGKPHDKIRATGAVA